MSDDVERRKDQRVPVRTIVRMRFQSIGDFLQSYAKDISSGGMQLAVAQQLDQEDIVGLEFKLKSNYPLIEGTAVVKWCRPHGEHYMIGVAFRDLDERSKKIIAEAVQIRLREQRGVDPDSEIGSDDDLDVKDISDTDVLAPPAEDDEEAVSETFSFEDVAAAATGDVFAPPDDIEEVTPGAMDAPTAKATEPEIEEMAFGIEVADEDAQAAFDVDAEAVEVVDDGSFGASLEALSNEVAAMPVAADTDLFEDTELATDGQAEFVFDLDGAAVDEQAPAAHTIQAVPRGGGRKRLLMAAAVVLVVGGAAAARLLTKSPAPLPVTDVVAPAAQRPEPVLPAAVTAAAAGTATVGVDSASTQSVAAVPAEHPLPEPSPPPVATKAAVPPPAAQVNPIPKPQPAPAPARAAAGATLRRLVGYTPGGGDVMLELSGDGDFDGHYKYFALSAPPRVVVDVKGVELSGDARAMRSNHPRVVKVRVGQHPDKVRIVLDLNEDRAFTVRAAGDRLIVEAK